MPLAPTLENYAQTFTEAPLPRFLLNAAIVCLAIPALQLLVIIPASYAFARMDFLGRNLLFGVVLGALVVPAYIGAIPNFLLVSSLHLTDTYAELVVPFVGSAFGIFLMRQFYR